MKFTAAFSCVVVLASSALAAPSITQAEHELREFIARQDGACTFASGDPPIPNNSNGCIPNHGLGGSPGVITCKDGVPTTNFCSNIFKSCSGANGSASCKVFGF